MAREKTKGQLFIFHEEKFATGPMDADLPKKLDGRVMGAFIRAVKPARATCCGSTGRASAEQA